MPNARVILQSMHGEGWMGWSQLRVDPSMELLQKTLLSLAILREWSIRSPHKFEQCQVWGGLAITVHFERSFAVMLWLLTAHVFKV